MRLLRVLVILAILLIGALAGYAYFGDMKPELQEMRLPVQLDLGAAPAATTPADPAPATTQPAATPAPAAEAAPEAANPGTSSANVSLD